MLRRSERWRRRSVRDSTDHFPHWFDYDAVIYLYVHIWHVEFEPVVLYGAQMRIENLLTEKAVS